MRPLALRFHTVFAPPDADAAAADDDDATDEDVGRAAGAFDDDATFDNDDDATDDNAGRAVAAVAFGAHFGPPNFFAGAADAADGVGFIDAVFVGAAFAGPPKRPVVAEGTLSDAPPKRPGVTDGTSFDAARACAEFAGTMTSETRGVAVAW
jgi:hypothetical protein